jgi:hypothetical protein
MKRLSDQGVPKADERGKYNREEKHLSIPEEAEEVIRNHIRSFPTVPSHYCRRDSRRGYLGPELESIAQMHRLYQEKCKAEAKPYYGIWSYEKIFHEFNLGFFQPKTDQCPTCCAYENAGPMQQAEMETEYAAHLKRKDSARLHKKMDKEFAAKSPEFFRCFTFDLQNVLSCPRTKNGLMFYKRKLL